MFTHRLVYHAKHCKAIAISCDQIVFFFFSRKATIYFTIYPEGTRFSPKKKNALAKSQNFAELMGLKKLNQVRW